MVIFEAESQAKCKKLPFFKMINFNKLASLISFTFFCFVSFNVFIFDVFVQCSYGFRYSQALSVEWT